MENVRKISSESKAYNKWMNYFLAVVYFLLTTGMYYYRKNAINLGIHFLYRFILAAVLVVLSFLIFLIHTDLKRGGQLIRYMTLLILPHLVIILSSVPVWVFGLQGLTQIRRGIFDQLYGVSSIMAVAGILYIFGKDGLWLNLGAMLTANLVTVVQGIWENGILAYLRELRTLIVTFASETGPIMQDMEVDELTFALGVYLILFGANWMKYRKRRVLTVLFGLTLFCFFSGFKRIGVAAIALGFLVWTALRFLARKRPYWLMIAAFVMIAVAFFYIVLVKNGIFDYISSKFGLDTMGRRELSAFIDEYYWVGPDYLGNGAGFVTRLFSDLPETYKIRALHNDILALYIDAGFWGFLLWMLCYFPLRTWVVYQWYGPRSAALCLSLQSFILATAATDNTIYYTYVIASISACLMGSWMEEKEVERA